MRKRTLFSLRMAAELIYSSLNTYPATLERIDRSTAAKKAYPKKFRLVHVWDPERRAYLKIITNNLSWTADTIAELYKARWDIEVFFKHLKQLFRVKSFVGASANAVRIQMWCAMIAMLLLRYLKNKAKYPRHLSNLITFLRLKLYSKISLESWIINPLRNPKNPQLKWPFLTLRGYIWKTAVLKR